MKRRSQGSSPAIGVLLGAGAGWLVHSLGNRRRRHTMRDRSAAKARRTTRRARRFLRYATSELYGAGQRAGHAVVHRRRELDDATLADKVRSILFRDGAIPKGNVNINAERGWVYLRGELSSVDLIRRAAQRAARIEGVRGVKNLLHTPDR